jgi:hypothetical protein
MEIKFELDMEKAVKATVAIAASYGLGQVSKGTEPSTHLCQCNCPHHHHCNPLKPPHGT